MRESHTGGGFWGGASSWPISRIAIPRAAPARHATPGPRPPAMVHKTGHDARVLIYRARRASAPCGPLRERGLGSISRSAVHKSRQTQNPRCARIARALVQLQLHTLLRHAGFTSLLRDREA